jgi:hypothetical protein
MILYWHDLACGKMTKVVALFYLHDVVTWLIALYLMILMIRTLPHWIRACHILPHATSHLQLSCHVRFRFSQYPCTVSVISPSSGIEIRHIRMCWNGDDDAVVLVLVPALESSWIMLCYHVKVPCHVFLANLVVYHVRP